MRRKRTYTEDEEPIINLTPLIDVVFVILIMFIVIAPLLEMDRIALAPKSASPEQESLSAQENSPITLHVYEDNTIKLNRQSVDLKTLPHLLEQAHLRHPQARPQLFHDEKAPFGTYQRIKNSLEIAGFEELDIILAPRGKR